jgi:hypothetical protein
MDRPYADTEYDQSAYVNKVESNTEAAKSRNLLRSAVLHLHT